jgi:hypothetical protein
MSFWTRLCFLNSSAAETEVGPSNPLPVTNFAERQTAAAPSTATVNASGGDLFTLAAGEIGYIQNLNVNPIFVRRATGAATNAFHYALAPGVAVDDGTGGSLRITDHVGVVSAVGTGFRAVAWKISKN